MSTNTRDEISLGSVAGLAFSAVPSAFVGFAVVWAALSVIAATLLGLPVSTAIVGGLIAAVLHVLSEIVHQLGHAWAARGTGYPMRGIRLWGVLSSSLYPADEPPLPAAIHIRRALGGPTWSLLAAILAAIIVLVVYPQGGVLGWFAIFFLVDNFFVFTLGSLLPLGFTDGSTLLHWWNKR